MKQLIFMIVVTFVGVRKSLVVSPVYGVTVYYFYAVLRPQYLWNWVLPEGIAWSFYVAVAAIYAYFTQVGSAESPLNSEDWQLSVAHGSILVFGGWVTLSFITAINHEVAYPWFVEYTKVILMFWLAARVIRTLKQIWMIYLLTAGSLGYIAYEINSIYFLNGHYIKIYHSGYGGLDNNGAGLMLAMGVPLCYFAWEGMRLWYRWVFLAMIPVIIHAVLMSYSRGAMVSLIATVPFFLLRGRRKIQLALFLTAIGFLVPILAGKEIRARFFTLEQTEIDESANSRRSSWAAAWRITMEYPILGVGVRCSNLLSHKYGADFEGRTIHSQYLQTSADSGLIALILYLTALIICWFSMRTARVRAKERDDEEGWRAYAMACGVEGAMIVFCVGATFLSLESFELPYLMLLLGAQLPMVLQATPVAAQETDTGDFSAEDAEADPTMVAEPC